MTAEIGQFESTVTGVTPFADKVPSKEKEKELLLAKGVRDFIQEYIALPDFAVTAVTLWVFHTYLLPLAGVTPYLHILAATRESGKTTFGDVLLQLGARIEQMNAISAAMLRRALDDDLPPTVLMDELDTTFSKKAEETSDFQQVLNLGYKRGAVVKVGEQVKGGKWLLKTYRVFAPKVLISIGLLPSPIESRSIPIRLERMMKTEKRKKFRERKAEAESQWLRDGLNSLQIEELAEPEVPDQLSSRQSDIWEPLLAIADWLGGEWPEQARAAAVWLHSQEQDEDPAAALLRHIKEVFDTTEREGMYSVDLVAALTANESWPYQHMEGNVPLDPARLAKKLKQFKIEPKGIRLYESDLATQRKGYMRTAFEEAWERYL